MLKIFNGALTFLMNKSHPGPSRGPRPAQPLALVSAIRLVDFAGSEITCLEIAQTLVVLGYQVVITATELGEPWLGEVPEGITVSRAEDIADNSEFDLLWLHHNLVAYKLLADKGIKSRCAIFSSLSFFEPMETPPITQISFSRYLVNSNENLRYFVDNYPALRDHVSVFLNGCPQPFFDRFLPDASVEVRSVLFVSNHPPEEVVELDQLLQTSGLHTKTVGVSGSVERVTPELLSEFDAVVTIGKTVQYCLGMGKPVFCYDHFGGPGWIVPETFAPALETNFSGRCTPLKRDAKELHREIMTGYEGALSYRHELRSRAKAMFSLAENVDEVLSIARKRPFSNGLSDTDAKSLSRLATIYEQQRQLVRHWQGVADLQQR